MKIRADSVSALDAALEGWGTAVGGVLTVGALGASTATSPEDDPGHGIHRAVEDGTLLRTDDEEPADRDALAGNVGLFEFDMLRRAAASEDGNAAFGTWDGVASAASYLLYGAEGPSVARSDCGDSSLQYAGEADGAARVLDGLNLVVPDVVAVALLGRRGEALRSGVEPQAREADGLAALTRICMRVLFDVRDAGEARRRLAAFRTELDRLAAATLSAPSGGSGTDGGA